MANDEYAFGGDLININLICFFSRLPVVVLSHIVSLSKPKCAESQYKKSEVKLKKVH